MKLLPKLLCGAAFLLAASPASAVAIFQCTKANPCYTPDAFGGPMDADYGLTGGNVLITIFFKSNVSTRVAYLGGPNQFFDYRSYRTGPGTWETDLLTGTPAFGFDLVKSVASDGMNWGYAQYLFTSPLSFNHCSAPGAIGSLCGRSVDYWANATGFSFTGNGEVTYYSTVVAVPEVASWAMMLGGFGAIGGAMRARRTRARYAAA